jgi:hypothetical protein
MFDTILEHSTFVGITGAIVVLALLWIWFQTGYRALIYAVVGVLAATIALVVLGLTIQTPREQLVAWLDSTAAELQANDFNALQARIHPGAAPELRALEASAQGFKFHTAAIKRIHDIEITGKEPSRKAVVKMNVFVELSTSGNQHKIPRYVELTLYQVDGKWMVYQARHEEPTYGFKKHDE